VAVSRILYNMCMTVCVTALYYNTSEHSENTNLHRS